MLLHSAIVLENFMGTHIPRKQILFVVNTVLYIQYEGNAKPLGTPIISVLLVIL